LKKQSDKKNNIDNTGRPRKNGLLGGKPYRCHAENGSYQFDITEWIAC